MDKAVVLWVSQHFFQKITGDVAKQSGGFAGTAFLSSRRWKTVFDDWRADRKRAELNLHGAGHHEFGIPKQDPTTAVGARI
jgi:hypothetical protein